MYICSMEKISKQIIVMRKDLNMRKGKMCSQSAHASLAAILNLMNSHPNESGQEQRNLYIDRNTALDDWLNGRFTKICVSVNSEKELDEIYAKAKEKRLICVMIVDAGLTEFKGVPTKTCCAIGPAWNCDVDQITGDLPLL